MSAIRGFTAKPLPAGADERTYRPGIKKERARTEEAQRRLAIARQAAKSPELREIEREYYQAVEAAGQRRGEASRNMPFGEAQEIYTRELRSLREEHDAKVAALPREKREIGKVDVTTFDFEAHERQQQERFAAMVREKFAPAQPRAARAVEKIVDREARIAVEGNTDSNHDNVEAAE